MSEGYAIELYFDTALENQVLKAWNILARRLISTKLIEIESRPHITLFSTPFIDPMKMENILKDLASKQEPIPISLSSIGTLSDDQNSFFFAPTPSLSLLHFHSHIHDAMEKEGIEVDKEYRRGSWVPYCPVAEEVPDTRMVEGFSLIREFKFPIIGYAMEIGLVEFSPVSEWFSFELGSSVETLGF